MKTIYINSYYSEDEDVTDGLYLVTYDDSNFEEHDITHLIHITYERLNDDENGELVALPAAEAPVVYLYVPQVLNYKAASGGVPWLTQPWGENSVLLPKLLGPWGSAVVSAPLLHMGNPLASAPGACRGGG